MGRAKFVVVLLGVAVALACLPAGALGATYNWNLTSDFTSTPPGANPDKDAYGGHPWSYENGQTLLSNFDVGVNGVPSGLAGWHDAGGLPLVAINPGAAPITSGNATYAAGQIVMAPGGSNPADAVWTSPVSGTVSVTGSTAIDNPSLACQPAKWSLLKNGTAITTPTGVSGSSFARSVPVASGDRIALRVSAGGLLGLLSCDQTGVTFNVSYTNAPAVTLASPANGALISGGQPTFSGTAGGGFGVSDQITIRVYSGPSASGTPVQTITTTATNGSYAAGPTAALADGQYTAQAEQDSSLTAGERALSQTTTFTLSNAAPAVTIDVPARQPFTTATPTFTGKASPNQKVTLAVYRGSGTNSTPIAYAVSNSGPEGDYQITVDTPLSDGAYTLVAGDGAGGLSTPLSFRVKVNPPAMTITDPAAGAHTTDSAPVLSGAAGTALGDSPQVQVRLYSGPSATGSALGTVSASTSGGTWTVRWPQRLKLGIYTVQASQTDDAGHQTIVSHTFLIVPANGVIGSNVGISQKGVASVPVSCLAPAGQVCTGTVMILTAKNYRTVSGGPLGRIRVLFAYVSIGGGRTVIVKRQVQRDALRALRRLRNPRVIVSTSMTSGPGPQKTVSAARTIRVARP